MLTKKRQAIAEAIAQERERAARVAEERALDEWAGNQNDYHAGFNEACKRIAARIREGGE